MGCVCAAACLHEMSIGELGSLTMAIKVWARNLHTLCLTGTGPWLVMVLNLQLSLFALVAHTSGAESTSDYHAGQGA